MRLKIFRSAGIVAFGLLAAPLPAGATVVNTYFGWNYVSDVVSGNPGYVAPAVMELNSFTYYGGADVGGGVANEAVNLPAFGAYNGLPDGVGLVNAPTFTTVANGDGETTRNNPNPASRTLPIDWVPANTPTPYLPLGVPYPTIAIQSFTTSVNNVLFGNYSGFPNDPGGKPWYIVGLIDNAAVPLTPSEELNSVLNIYQGDIYERFSHGVGNPTLSALNAGGPGDLVTVVFAAAAPEPASLAVLAPGALLLAWKRRRRAA